MIEVCAAIAAALFTLVVFTGAGRLLASEIRWTRDAGIGDPPALESVPVEVEPVEPAAVELEPCTARHCAEHSDAPGTRAQRWHEVIAEQRAAQEAARNLPPLEWSLDRREPGLTMRDLEALWAKTEPAAEPQAPVQGGLHVRFAEVRNDGLVYPNRDSLIASAT